MSVSKQPTPKSISDIKLKCHSYTNIPQQGEYENYITGCTVLPDLKMVFADFDKGRLVILTVDGEINNEISCCDPISGPYDVTRIDDRTVAVTTDSGIKIISIESKQTERTIKTTGKCYGITHHEGALLWCEVSTGIQMLQLTDQSVTTAVKQDTLGYWAYITTYGDYIYQTEMGKDTVTCFTTKGDKLWEYKDNSVIRHPTGVAVDNNHNIYITSSNTNSVVLLSPDGKQGRKLHEDWLQQPFAIHYDVQNNKLLVCNCDGHGFLYDILKTV